MPSIKLNPQEIRIPEDKSDAEHDKDINWDALRPQSRFTPDQIRKSNPLPPKPVARTVQATTDEDAPLGRDDKGEPLAPYGRKADGTIRKRPAPSPETTAKARAKGFGASNKRGPLQPLPGAPGGSGKRVPPETLGEIVKREAEERKRGEAVRRAKAEPQVTGPVPSVEAAGEASEAAFESLVESGADTAISAAVKVLDDRLAAIEEQIVALHAARAKVDDARAGLLSLLS